MLTYPALLHTHTIFTGIYPKEGWCPTNLSCVVAVSSSLQSCPKMVGSNSGRLSRDSYAASNFHLCMSSQGIWFLSFFFVSRQSQIQQEKEEKGSKGKIIYQGLRKRENWFPSFFRFVFTFGERERATDVPLT